jgi:MinD-like ATPase involved in chromosome partitioning or flagellar assembly
VTIVAVVGDASTTSTVALAVTWPDGDLGDVIVLDADPGGGSLAGWLDTPSQPSLATIVANIGAEGGLDGSAVLTTVDAMTHRSATGVRFIANAVRSRAAHRALDEAAAVVLPAIAAASTTVIADVGRHLAGQVPPATLRHADVVLVVHRQAPTSAGAATVRVERLAETIEDLARLDATIVLAVIGDTPFGAGEIGAFVDTSVPGAVRQTVILADDPLAAAVIAGRTGVSGRRLRRLPLMRDAARVADVLAAVLAEQFAPRRGVSGATR